MLFTPIAKIITSNDNVRTVCVLKDAFTDASIIRKLRSASRNQVPMCRGKSMSDIHNCLCVVYGGNVMAARTVCEWVYLFHDEKRTNIQHKARERRP